MIPNHRFHLTGLGSFRASSESGLVGSSEIDTSGTITSIYINDSIFKAIYDLMSMT